MAPAFADAPGRHILLDAGQLEQGARRFIIGGITLGEGNGKSWVTLTRTGKFSDPRYGEFEITRTLLEEMVRNFTAGTYGQKVFIDVAHKPQDGAAGEIVELRIEGDRLRALIEWTDYGREAVQKRGFRYMSAEYHENWKDNEAGTPHGCVLLGAGLVTRPCIKRLDPVTLSEADRGEGANVPTAMHPTLLAELIQEVRTMWEKQLKALREQLAPRGLSAAAIDSIVATATKALEAITDEGRAKSLCDTFAAMKLGEDGKPAPVSVNVQGVSAEDVKRILSEDAAARAAEAKKLSESLDAKRKLFTDHLAEVGKALSEETRKSLGEDVADIITAGMGDDAVKALAEKLAKRAESAEASRQLSAMGFTIAGNPHISVDSSNEVKALQESIDKRVGITSLSDAVRFKGTGGTLRPENKALADKVLAAFDNAPDNARRLHAEHRMLSGGDGVVSDVAVPAIFERTVIREMLYRLVGLQFVDSGTYAFSGSAIIPYSYRDPAAAGRDAVRTYEGQGVRRAGVIQTSDTAYPIPQKLAFEVSDELRYLTGNGVLNFDIVSENVSNAIRIIGEDTERLIFDEQLNASDEYGAVPVVDEAVATANGTNRIFVLDNFPVVRPRTIRDLQGNQVGNTLNPVTIKLNSVTIQPWAAGVSAGTYYVLDYNLGEVRFVNAAGDLITPTNTHAIVASYSYATNVFKFDTDLGSLTVEEKWDNFLYRYGLRKSLLEDTRSHSCDMGLMSGTVMTSIEQARSFVANFKRTGTDLSIDGNLGQVKGVPNFKAYAPGLAMADQRVLLGERGLTRMRMMKPWSMGQLENQRDENGRFTGKKEAYGDQFIVLHTPTPLKAGLTSIVLYGGAARVDRAS